ncbi:carnitine transporter [Malassezia vespertilionis]|uniref:Crc1p n=1 Tax=Malassezia vespertilionis TaxID=2020962 RepID=A0A2N1JAK4_9BASI|nr:carnitine transporter [Malassezia vespertilionis]PKI83588.1 Crc1p [Malassezia vespertilionis]WFD07493.1 carnitine transporter [Malassezia vespertilionis]
MADDAASEGVPLQKEPTGFASAAKSFVSGGFGGVCAILVGHPFDLIKTRLQTAPPGTYTNAMDVVKKTIAADGARGLYRGMGPPLIGVTPIFALSFLSYDMGKQLVFAATPNRKSKELSLGELAFAGFFSAIPTVLVAGPAERVKVLLQLQGQSSSGPAYNGPLDVVRQLYKEGGLRSIFKGTGATLARDGPGSAAYFVAYEAAKRALTPKNSDPSNLNIGTTITAGGLAGMAMWSIAIPPDVIKSRFQGAPEGTYKSFLDCARRTVGADGIGALFKGFGPAMARAFPANAAVFVGVEMSFKMMDRFF